MMLLSKALWVNKSQSIKKRKIYTNEKETYLKGTLTWDFCPVIFHQTTFPGSLIRRLKPFQIWLWICEDNQQRWMHSGVIDTDGQPTFVWISSRIIWHTVFIWKSASAAQDTAVTLKWCQWQALQIWPLWLWTSYLRGSGYL
jgi:hypothetical protein